MPTKAVKVDVNILPISLSSWDLLKWIYLTPLDVFSISAYALLGTVLILLFKRMNCRDSVHQLWLILFSQTSKDSTEKICAYSSLGDVCTQAIL